MTTPEPPEGAFAEEWARLLAAFQDWAAKGRTAAKDLANAHGEAAGADAGHSTECAICPICQGIRLLRGARPEVVEHLGDAATSFLAALATLLPAEEAEPTRRERERAQHIDVFGDDGPAASRDVGRSDGPTGTAS